MSEASINALNEFSDFNEGKFNETLAFFRAVGDQTRLTIIGHLLGKEHNVGELAERLNLKEPTVSHHLSKLRAAGILTLRHDGNQRFYSLNRETVRDMGKHMLDLSAFKFEVEQESLDYGWLEALNLDEFAYKTLRACTTPDQRLTHIPRKHTKLIVVLEWLVSFFKKDHIYTESEINEVLKARYEDFSGLRRDLVDMKYLRRDRSGSKYLFEGSFLQYLK